MNNLLRKIKTARRLLFIKKNSHNVIKYSDEEYNKKLYKLTFGKDGDFKNPKTFNEHIISLKLYADEDELWRYTDKYAVRGYVENTIGKQYLNDVIAVYDSADEIDFDVLPEKFALKATHGSGFNVVVKDKNTINKEEVKSKFRKWLAENYYYHSRERNYKDIKPRIVCEKFLEALSGKPLNEIKLMCFNGKVKLIADTRIINGKRTVDLYNETKNRIAVKMGEANHNLGLPENIDEMIDIAEKLSDKFKFVRVDLYNIEGKIIFSELTFHSGGGLVPFYPKEYDLEFGSLFE